MKTVWKTIKTCEQCKNACKKYVNEDVYENATVMQCGKGKKFTPIDSIKKKKTKEK